MNLKQSPLEDTARLHRYQAMHQIYQEIATVAMTITEQAQQPIQWMYQAVPPEQPPQQQLPQQPAPQQPPQQLEGRGGPPGGGPSTTRRRTSTCALNTTPTVAAAATADL